MHPYSAPVHPLWASAQVGPLRLWGLWITLDARSPIQDLEMDPDLGAPVGTDSNSPEWDAKWVDLGSSPVSRVKWQMMGHHSLDLWQVHLFHDSPLLWGQWLPEVCPASRAVLKNPNFFFG